jgi:predicted Zn-dependent protease
VHVADDPGAARGLPFPFDLEGTPSVRVPLLEGGRVGSAVTDLASAARSGLPPTGHAHIAREESPQPVPASITMAPGRDTDLLGGVERGLYVQRFWYLRVVDPDTTVLAGSPGRSPRRASRSRSSARSAGSTRSGRTCSPSR